MTTLFVSDLHLDDARPEVTTLFLRFLAEEARGADALYVLGDLFEAWVGDDDPVPLGAAVAEGLRAVRDAGTRVCFMRGNRDFLVGADYAARAGMEILADPAVAVVEGRPVLLLHGDLLCTADTGYMAFRAQTRHPDWQSRFLAQPLQARLAFAQQAREQSRTHQAALQQAGTMETITDVSAETVAQYFVRYGIDLMIHGHTHRPAVHEVDAGGRRCRRVVLGDWYEQGSVLRMRGDDIRLEVLA
ncbi:UDP-2,3-diacylglucosamine diphosphatase [Lysobacter humi (ex Lee et al. 2017)]